MKAENDNSYQEIRRLHETRPDEPHIRDADSLPRGSEELPEQIISERRVSLWAFDRTGQLCNDQDKVNHDEDGRGYIRCEWGSSAGVHNAEFVGRRFREWRSFTYPYHAATDLLKKAMETAA